MRKLARFCCKSFLSNQRSVMYSASQVAASGLMAAINISRSKVAAKQDMAQFEDLAQRFFYNDETSETDYTRWGPLADWNTAVEEVTKLDRKSDIAAPYRVLLEILDETRFDGSLAKDPTLKVPKQ